MRLYDDDSTSYHMPSVPFKVGHYEVLEPVGYGGTAVVYRALLKKNDSFTREVAIKILRPAIAQYPENIEMFKAEATIGSLVNHPNLLPIYDHGYSNGFHYMVMDYIKGQPLSELLAISENPWPPQLAAHIAISLASALEYIHTLHDPTGIPMGLVHRDVTPHNVLISRDGQVFLTDLGIAHYTGRERYTGRGQIRGKLTYLSPEQAADRPVTLQTDIFALGLILWEMLSGRPRYDNNRPDVFTDILMAQYLSPRNVGVVLDKSMERLLRKCLMTDPEERWSSAALVAEALAPWDGGYAARQKLGAIVTDIEEGHYPQIASEMPTVVHSATVTREYAKGKLDPGKTLILEENIVTSILDHEDLKRIDKAFDPTRLIEQPSVSSNSYISLFLIFLAGILTGFVIIGGMWWSGVLPFHDTALNDLIESLFQ